MRQPRWRRARKQALKAQGIPFSKPCRVWCLIVPADYVPNLEITKRIVPGLGGLVGQLWLPRPDAKYYFRSIPVLGVLKTEFKRCLRCHRPTVGDAAEKLREMYESSPMGRELPCGANCEADRKLGIWQRESDGRAIQMKRRRARAGSFVRLDNTAEGRCH